MSERAGSFMKWWAVFRTLLNVNLRISYVRQMFTGDRRRLPGTLAVAGAMAWAGYVLISGYVRLLEGLYGPLRAAGQSGAILALATVGAQLAVMFPGVFWVMSSFYFSKDSALLGSLPISHRLVAAAHIGVLLIGEYATVALFLVPALAVWGVKSGAGAAYWLSAAAVFLMSPAVPLALSALAAMAIMRVANVRRYKNAIMVAGTVAFFALYLWFQYWIAAQAPATSEDMAALLMTQSESLMRLVGLRFPPAIWTSEALAYAGSARGLVGLAGTFAASLVAMAVVVLLAPKLVGAGLASTMSVEPGRRALPGSGAGEGASGLPASMWTERSAASAIALRDMRALFRTSAFALNSIANSLILPGLLAVWFLAGSGSNVFTSDIPGLETLLQSPETEPYRGLVLSGLMTLVAGMNMVAASSFSRDGAQFWMDRSIPVAVSTIVDGKARFALAFNAAAAGIMAVVVQLIVGLDAATLALAVATGLAGVLWATLLAMAIDAFRPYLTWNDPHKAMKQNLNGIAAALAVAGVLVALGWLVARAAERGVSGHVLLVAVGVAFAALAVPSGWWLVAAATNSYGRIEQ
ncbi:MAG: hypothetical protein GX183_01045 [Firmicutes bacterium]|jgi:ABC-2 type transport system permease protein|nr:hypothetical protein [Bacillota bacterium]